MFSQMWFWSMSMNDCETGRFARRQGPPVISEISTIHAQVVVWIDGSRNSHSAGLEWRTQVAWDSGCALYTFDASALAHWTPVWQHWVESSESESEHDDSLGMSAVSALQTQSQAFVSHHRRCLQAWLWQCPWTHESARDMQHTYCCCSNQYHCTT